MFFKIPILISIISVYYYIIWYGIPRVSKPDNSSYNPMKYGQPKLSSNSYLDNQFPPRNKQQIGTENATIVMLVRNSELEGALDSIRSLEDRFNRNYKYPWIFMNDEPFDEEFKEQTTLMASGETFYELIPAHDWEPPSFIDEEKLQQSLQKAEKEGVIYGGMRSYRNMCHFNSGFFYKQKRLLNYDWYFRVEPDVEYMCDFQYDPFKVLRENNKLYGFTIAILEYENTIPGLWNTVEGFMKEYPHMLHPNNSLDFLTTYETELNKGAPLVESSSNYNLCHFWSNFEIANLNFFRSLEYNTYFDYLDRTGGFYYERWGDAPVHTIGLSLLMDKEKIHHFEDIGYYHAPYLACPISRDVLSMKRCRCRKKDHDNNEIETPIDINYYSCLSRWWKYGCGKKFLNEMDYTFNN